MITLSPSSRRAWIEMTNNMIVTKHTKKSPSSRRAWIEMSLQTGGRREIIVALLAEGVDRNFTRPNLVSAW